MYSANLAFREVKNQPVSGERARAAGLKARTLSSGHKGSRPVTCAMTCRITMSIIGAAMTTPGAFINAFASCDSLISQTKQGRLFCEGSSGMYSLMVGYAGGAINMPSQSMGEQRAFKYLSGSGASAVPGRVV